MKVFLTGATGYIGFEVAKAFRRAGHEVYGLTRSEEKSAMLKKEEIIPVIGSMNEPDSYKEAARNSELIIHAAMDYAQDTAELDKQTVETILGLSGGDKAFIYTSGCWVQGNTGGSFADESTPLEPIDMVAWRPAIEDIVLQSNRVNGTVIRPGCVYGKRGGLFGNWFDSIVNKNELGLVGDGSNRWALVHIDDLTDAYLLAAGRQGKGALYNISNRESATIGEMAKKVARAAGFNGNIDFIPLEKAREFMGPFADAMALDQRFNPEKAEKELGWRQNHKDFILEAGIYLDSWKAGN